MADVDETHRNVKGNWVPFRIDEWERAVERLDDAESRLLLVMFLRRARGGYIPAKMNEAARLLGVQHTKYKKTIASLIARGHVCEQGDHMVLTIAERAVADTLRFKQEKRAGESGSSVPDGDEDNVIPFPK